MSTKEYNRRYYLAHREEIIERSKKYIKEHQERVTALNRERRLANPETQKNNSERAKKWYEDNKERSKKYFDNYKKANTDKVVAAKAVENALRRGDMVRSNCEICGAEKAEAHHDDYNYPLRVRWLCRSCHKAWHSKNKPVRVKI